MTPITLIGAGVLLFGLGLGLGYLLSHSLRKREATKACEVQKELDEYRRSVTEHFSETAEHFQVLGQQYRSLYKHMAHGAEALCDPAQSDAMLEFPTGGSAVLASSVEETGVVPEAVRDYAPAEADEPVHVEATAEEPETPETLVDISPTDETVAEPGADEEMAEAVSKPTAGEAERTVH